MEPDVIRLYSSSPPPMEDAEEDDEDEFGDFGAFSTVSSSFSELDASGNGSFNQTHAPDATSPPELPNGLGTAAVTCHEAKANGVLPGSNSAFVRSRDRSDVKRPSDSDVTGGEIITNGFAASDVKPGAQIFVRCNVSDSRESEFADFAAFSDTGSQLGAIRGPGHGDAVHQGCGSECVDGTVPDSKAATLPESCDMQPDAKRRDADLAQDTITPCTNQSSDASGEQAEDGACVDGIHNDCARVDGFDGTCVEGNCLDGVDNLSGDALSVEVVSVNSESVDSVCDDGSGFDGVCEDGPRFEAACADDARVSVDGVAFPMTGNGDSLLSDGRTSETETETSLGRPLSTDALEEFGDVSTTGSAPSPPPLQEETATPADHSQLDEDEEFGDFGDVGSFGEQPFADFNHQETSQAQSHDDFGDFSTPKMDANEEGESTFTCFSAAGEAEWNAFGEAEQAAQVTEGESATGESWAAFSSMDDTRPAVAAEEAWYQAETCTVDQDNSRQTEALCSRVEKLLEMSFPQATGPSPAVEEQVVSLKTLVEARADVSSVWSQLQDIHEAVGLRHQWGGSYCNKTLLGCLGIDTRNILFTGQKKQPLIVPVYAASLGMLEPTKEPVKPVSAAEIIASIAQAPAAAALDSKSCPSDAVQEVLPPVQFDWSSSGLTNPLDGVDPELVELTTAKMESGGAGSRVVDAFARLMSTVDKTSTSTKKPRKDEKLSSEAAQVICGLPDLSFMQAKVLMFPATLRPLACQATPPD
ncbi:aftiphilin a isoform X2 [Syngnathoides biaculeatus]|uniref:aftiphilin a isoform X2 n=1 Tax=Syngnathoides biaculeatus TaxID=300417 RepID=UPI002ADDCFA5|nr:aftiphilin a isoform X2 [Syngnathoides biaculeatus]